MHGIQTCSCTHYVLFVKPSTDGTDHDLDHRLDPVFAVMGCCTRAQSQTLNDMYYWYVSFSEAPWKSHGPHWIYCHGSSMGVPWKPNGSLMEILRKLHEEWGSMGVPWVSTINPWESHGSSESWASITNPSKGPRDSHERHGSSVGQH